MGFFDFLNDAAKKAEKRTNRQSALRAGRMRETDKIKGSDSPLPKEPGMYRHVDKKTGNVDYVGQTDNLKKRQQEHARSGKLDTSRQKVQYGTAQSGASKDALLKTEVDHIARHKPSGNKTKGGNGRR